MRYVTKMMRDGGLAFLLIGLAATHAIENQYLSWAAIVAGAGAAISAIKRMPLAANELNGFRGLIA